MKYDTEKITITIKLSNAIGNDNIGTMSLQLQEFSD